MHSRNLILPLLALFLLLSTQGQSQNPLFAELSKAVDADLDIEGYRNTVKFLKKQNCLVSDDIVIPYLETIVKSAPKLSIYINSEKLNPANDYIVLTSGGDIAVPAYFYNIEEPNKDNVFTYIKMDKYIDSKVGVEGNKKKGYAQLKNLILRKGYQNIILVDNFGMPPLLVEGLKDYLKGIKSNILLVPYSVAEKHFTYEGYYYTEILNEVASKKIQKSFLKIQNRKQTTQNVALTGLLPDKREADQQNYLKSLLYNYIQISKQMPGVHITLYLLPQEDLQLIKKKYQKDLSNEQLLLGNIIFRDLNSIFPAKALVLEGQHVRDPRRAIHGTQYAFRLNYIENNRSKEELIGTTNDLALVIGGANTPPSWKTYNQNIQDDLVRLLRNYIQFQITSHASHSPSARPQSSYPNTGF